MSQPSDGDPPIVRREDSNSTSIYLFPMFSVPGGWERLESASLAWLENAGVPQQRRRIIPPNAAVAASVSFPNMSSRAMDLKRSFNDMIIEGCTPAALSDNVPRTNETPACDEAPTSVKGNRKRSKNFSVQEDEMLVSAWLNVSLDPEPDQPRLTYWKRIYDYFHSNRDFFSDRTQNSLMSRWSGIQHDVNIFASCVSRVEGRNQSGLSIDDKQTNALTMFKEEDKMHRNFPYIHCWKKSKDQSKWMNRNKRSGTQKLASKRQKTTEKSCSAQLVVSSNVDDIQPATPTLDRPVGKKEKDKLGQHSSIEALDYLLAKKKEGDTEKEMKREEWELKKEERCHKALALQEERIKLEKDKFDFERDLEEERIMNVDTSTLSTKQKQFYEQLQDKILARRLEN